jgi:outer membrane protein assembly factor BamB
VKRHLLSLAIAAGIAGILGGCSTDEPKLITNTGTIENLPARSFKLGWTAALDLKKDDAIDRVFVNEDLVFAYSKKNYAYAINRGSGLIRFNTYISDTTIKPHDPVVLKERIIFPTDSTLEVYRRVDGRLQKSFKTRSSLRTNAVGSPTGTRVFFGVDTPGAGRVVAVETLPGQYADISQKWEMMSDKGAAINSTPATLAGVVYVAFDDGWVYAVNSESRQSIWETATGPTYKTYGPITADLRVDEFGVYVPSTDTKFYCLDKTQGRTKWSYYAGASLRANPEVTAGMVYLPVTGRGIVAIDKINGPVVREPRWILADAVKLVSEDEKYAYFQRPDNSLAAVDKATGEQKFTSRRTDFVAFATNTKDAVIYAGTRDGKVVAITPVLKPDVGEIALDDGRVVIDAVAMR